MRKHTDKRIPIVATLLLASAGFFGVEELVELEVGPAHAVIGRPLTPVSGAGMARRTARRTSRRTAARVSGGYGYGAYGYGYGYAPGVVAALPAGCARRTLSGALVYDCAGTIYRPVYDGGDVVYIEE